MPAGTWELVCHPGYNDHALEQANTRLRSAREVERGALLAVVPQVIENNAEIVLIDFHDLRRGRSVVE